MHILLKKYINNIFFRPSWYAVLVNPYFIARYYLYNNIKNFAKTVGPAKILDVGCGSKPYKDLFGTNEYVGIDIQGGGHLDEKKSIDAYFDGKTIPYGAESFDVVLCTQVLEHVEDPDALLRESYRVLKNNGIIYLTMPFIWPEHEVPYDFRRFTRFEHEKIFKDAGFKIEKIDSTCGVFGTCGQLISAYIFENLRKFSLVLAVIFAFLLCFPIQFLAIVMDTILRNNWITLDYVIIARK